MKVEKIILRTLVSSALGAKRVIQGDWVGTQFEAEIPEIMIGWCFEAPLRMSAGLEAEPDNCRRPLAPLRLSIAISKRLCHEVLWEFWVEKIGTTHYLGGHLGVHLD